MRISRMTPQDLPEVARLERESFSEPWSEKALADSLALDYYIFLTAKEDGKLAGYLGMYMAGEEGNITNIAVVEKVRRRGAARMLLEQLFSVAQGYGLRDITLEVRESNEPALLLYEGMGFQRVGVRKNFYRDPRENAVLMTRTLDSPDPNRKAGEEC